MSSLQDLQDLEEQLEQTISELAPLLSTPRKQEPIKSKMTQTDESPDSVSTSVRNLQEEIELEGEETMQDALEEEPFTQEESKPKAKVQLKKPPPEQTPAAMPPPATTTPLSPPLITMTDAQLQALLASIPSSAKKKRRKLSVPRVGGSDEDGVWSGYGLNEEGMEPTSSTCYRGYYDTDLKASRAAKSNDKEAQLGLRATSENLFCRSNEGSSKGASVLKDLHMLVQEHGFEGVFNIITRTGRKVNMFLTPGLCTKDMVQTWVYDMTHRGVSDEKGGRLPLCPWDELICKLSWKTVINSCSDSLRQDLLDTFKPIDRIGPWVLYVILTKVYRSDLTKLETLKEALKAIDILGFEGQNVTLYKLAVAELVREIMMNYTTPDPIPDLAIVAIAGLAKSGVPSFQLKVVSKMLELNSDPTEARSAQTALDLLDEFEAEYISLVQMKQYPPALKPTAETQQYKAMQAKVKYLEQEMAKLSQDRSASSTTGNKNITKVGPNVKCFTCGGNHLARDHDLVMGKDPSSHVPDGTSPRHGLSEEVAKKCNEAIAAKVKTMPAFVNIPDDAQYCIEVGGVTCAKFCRHCLRFVKGTNQHYTTEHKGPRKVKYQPLSNPSDDAAAAPAPSPSPAPAPAGSTTGAAKVAAAAPAATPGLVRFGPSTSYSLGWSAPTAGGFMARASSSDSDSGFASDSDSDSFHSFGFLDARDSLNE